MSKIRVDEIVDVVDEGSPDLPHGATCAEPTADNQVATKSYVDSSSSGTFSNSVSATPPGNAAVGSFWVDNSTSLNVLKCWNGSVWEEFSGMVGGVAYLMGIVDPTMISPTKNAGYPDIPYTPSTSEIASISGTGGGIVTSPINLAATWQDITYGNGKFVAVASNPPQSQTDRRVMWSSDGLNWTAADHAEANQWKGVIYGDGKYVAVASSGTNRVMWSTDAITWNSASCPSNSWAKIAYGEPNGQPTFVAIAAANSGDRFMYSHDAITWSSANPTVSENYWYDVAYGDGKFVAVASTTDADRCKYSTDGISWTTGAAGLPAIGLKGITYGEPNGQPTWVIAAPNNTAYYSHDAINWTACTGVVNNPWEGITYGEPGGQPLFVSVSTGSGDSNKHAMYSSDGISWTNVQHAVNTNSTNINYSWRPVGYGDGKFITIASWAMSTGQSEIIGYSYDGTSWNAPGLILTLANDKIMDLATGEVIAGETIETGLVGGEVLQDSINSGVAGTLAGGFSGNVIELNNISGAWTVGMKIRSLRTDNISFGPPLNSWERALIGSIPTVSQGAISVWGIVEWNLAEDSAFTTNLQTAKVNIVRDQTQLVPSSINIEANKDYYVRIRYGSLEPAISFSNWSETIAFKTDTVTFPGPGASPWTDVNTGVIYTYTDGIWVGTAPAP